MKITILISTFNGAKYLREQLDSLYSQINIKDIDFYENRLKVLGKRSKERMVYLNSACVDALNKYLAVRKNNPKAADEPALFISNQNRRISRSFSPYSS